jgi:uncharacterized Zn finger protein
MENEKEKDNSKREIILAFEKNSFLEFRKYIFKRGISVQDFFSHVMTIINNRGEECENLMSLIKAAKMDKIKSKKEERIVEDMFYDMFEEKFK